MHIIIDLCSWTCFIFGSSFAIIGLIGIIRFPDVYTRMHAASLVETLGIGLIILGLILQAGISLISIKLAIIFIFLFFTGPTSTHALARSLRFANIKPYLNSKKKQQASKKN